MSTYVESYGHFRTVMCIFEKDTICLGISMNDGSWLIMMIHLTRVIHYGRTLLDTSLHQILLFAIVLYGVPVLWNRYLLCSISLFAVGLQGQKRANGALCSRIFAPLNAEFEPRFCSRVQKHQLRASNGERSKNRVTFDPFFSVRRSPFAVQVTKSQPYPESC